MLNYGLARGNSGVTGRGLSSQEDEERYCSFRRRSQCPLCHPSLVGQESKMISPLPFQRSPRLVAVELEVEIARSQHKYRQVRAAMRPYMRRGAFRELSRLLPYVRSRGWREDFYDEVLALAAEGKLGQVTSFEGRVWRGEEIKL